MRTARIKVYKFTELNEKAQTVALDKLCNINVDHDWWKPTYDDAESVGLKISSFDYGKIEYCEGIFLESATAAMMLILKEHVESCDTYMDALNYQNDYDKLVLKYSDGINTNVVKEGSEHDFDTLADELDSEFLNELLASYKIILKKEYEYLRSRRIVIKAIIANDYEFTQDGKMF